MPMILGLGSLAAAQTVSAPVATVQPGDALRITVWRKPELSGEFVIASDGTVAHPLYRALQTTGATLPEIHARFRTFLESLEANPQFVIEPLVRVAVSGEVRQPNLYRIAPGTTADQVVALAGGITERGRLDRVRILRSGREIMIDLTMPGAELSADAQLRSGDRVHVSRRVSIYRDYIVPTASVTAAIGTIVSIYLRAR